MANSLGRIQVREGFRDGLGEEEAAAAAAETVQARKSDRRWEGEVCERIVVNCLADWTFRYLNLFTVSV